MVQEAKVGNSGHSTDYHERSEGIHPFGLDPDGERLQVKSESKEAYEFT